MLLGKEEALELLYRPGVSLILGYHPRANIDLLLDLSLLAVGRGLRSMVLDCDRTVSLELLAPRVERERLSRVLLSHPEDLDSLRRDLESCILMEDVGGVAINRPSSLIGEADLVKKFEQKGRFWRSTFPAIRGLAGRAPVVILEDSRRGDRIEYRVHPALYYLSGTILDAAEDGKRVEHYRIVKKRPEDIQI